MFLNGFVNIKLMCSIYFIQIVHTLFGNSFSRGPLSAVRGSNFTTSALVYSPPMLGNPQQVSVYTIFGMA